MCGPHLTQQPLLALHLLGFHLVQAQSTYSIADLYIYEIQKECVRNRLYNLPSLVDCPDRYNECICRDDTYQLAYSALSSAIPDVCSNNAVDMSSAVFVYTEYCNSAMASYSLSSPPTDTSPNSSPSASLEAIQEESGGR